MSAVNSVEMGGGEKYLVVSAFCVHVDSARTLLIMSKSVSLAVARIRVEIRERGTPKPEKARHGRRHHLSIRFERCQLVFVSRQH